MVVAKADAGVGAVFAPVSSLFTGLAWMAGLAGFTRFTGFTRLAGFTGLRATVARERLTWQRLAAVPS